jgi:hypothetical protein
MDVKIAQKGYSRWPKKVTPLTPKKEGILRTLPFQKQKIFHTPKRKASATG